MSDYDYLKPLEFDSERNEAYLQLPPPFSHIRLTPPRFNEDLEGLVEILNEEGVWPFLYSPPYPYLREHGTEWLEMIELESRNLLDLLARGSSVVGGCPVRYLREIKPDGTEVFLGDIGIARNSFLEVADTDERMRVCLENMNREVGDPEIQWMVGYFIRTSHQGRGIISTALKYLIDQWVIPKMGVKKILATVYEENKGSLSVLEKAGFKAKGEPLKDYQEIPESKGGGRKTLIVMRWVNYN